MVLATIRGAACSPPINGSTGTVQVVPASSVCFPFPAGICPSTHVHLTHIHRSSRVVHLAPSKQSNEADRWTKQTDSTLYYCIIPKRNCRHDHENIYINSRK